MAKAVKKRWFKIVAPKLFNNRIVGEVPVTEPDSLKGRSMKTNMFTLTDNMRKQNTEVNLLIDNVQGDQAKTSMIGYRILPTSIKRLVRKGRTRIDLTTKAITKDEKVVTIKILLITRNLVKGSVSRTMVTETKRILEKKISSSNFNELCETIVYGKIQKELKEKLAKTYPLRICDIREFKLERFLKATELRKIKARKPVAEPKEEVKAEEETKEEDVKEVKKEKSEKDGSEEEGKKETEKEEEPEKKEEEPEKEVKEEKEKGPGEEK